MKDLEIVSLLSFIFWFTIGAIVIVSGNNIHGFIIMVSSLLSGYFGIKGLTRKEVAD